MAKLAHACSQAIEYLFYALFFFTPLILWPKTSEVFEFNKMLFVYLVAGLIAAAWLTKSLVERKLEIRRTPLDIPLLLFLISQVLSTVFSIHPQTSLWGYYSRFHGGLMSTLSYILLFYAFVTFFYQKKRQLSLVLLSILSSAALVSIYAILEHFGIDKHVWIQDVQSRVFSTLGQPNWLSAYLIAILPLPIFLSLKSNHHKGKASLQLLTLAIFTAILFTKSRSGIGTTAIILTIIAIMSSRAPPLSSQTSPLSSRAPVEGSLQLKSDLKGFLHFGRNDKNTIQRSQKNNFIIGFWLLVITTLVVGTPWTPNPKQITERLDLGGPLWPEAESYLNKIKLTTQLKPLQVDRLSPDTQKIINDRLQGIRVGGSDSFDIRRVVWDGALKLARRYPLFGTGVETFGYSYYWVRPAAHNLLSEWEFLYNKAHNEYLNFLATTGYFGLGSYLVLIVWTLLWWIQVAGGNKALLMGWVSILITNFFGFSVVIIGLLFFLFPALAYCQSTTKTKVACLKLPAILSPVAYLTPFLTIFLAAFVYNIFRSDLLYNTGKAYASAGYLDQALPLLEKAVKISPKEALFIAQLAEVQANATLAIAQQLAGPLATASADYKENAQALIEDFAGKALENSYLAVKLNPYHVNIFKSKAKVELALAVFKPEYTNTALNTLLELSALAPTDPKILYNIGLVYEQMGLNNQAKQAYEKALELKPDYSAVKDHLGTF
ncbi:O-antigen ligase family protein [Candidatus Collierbacteria bacterium]|nr:O-antigen ligase family protein [Candidatus Collierbacteria bacterium]